MKLAADFARRRRLVVFVGAGVSVGPPTCLPSWWDLNEAVLHALADRVAHLVGADQAAAFVTHVVASQRADKLPPEYQAEITAGRLRESYFEVLQCLDSEQPNRSHRLLTEMARAGLVRAILTTNFDRALETAFEQAGVPCRVHSHPDHFKLLATGLARFEAQDAPCQLLKLHGSAEDPGTLIDTLAQRKVGLPPATIQCVRHLLRFGHWLFLGFSGSDLAAEPNYLHLRGDGQQARGFSWLVRTQPRAVVQELARLYGSDRAQIVHGELPAWLDALGAELQITLPPAAGPGLDGEALSAQTKTRVFAHARSWAERQRLDRCTLVVADLLDATSRPEDAFRLVQKLHDQTPENARQDGHFGVVLNSLALLYLARGEPQRALVLFRQSQTLLDQLGLEPQRLGLLSNVALLAQRQGRYDEALELLTSAREFFARHEDREALGIVLHNLANVQSHLGHFDLAIDLFRQEVEIVRVLGDEPGRGQALNDLGELLNRLNRYEEARAVLSEALELRTRLGDEHARALTLGNLSNIHLMQRQYDEAVPIIEECCRIFRLFDDRHHLATALGNLAYVAVLRKQFAEAVGLIGQALPLAEQTGDTHGRQRLLRRRAEVEMKTGNVDGAYASLEQARLLCEQLKDPVELRDFLLEWGSVHGVRGEFAEAERAFRESLELATQFPAAGKREAALERLAHVLNQHGLRAQQRDDHDLGLRCFEESADLWAQHGSTFNRAQTLRNVANTYVITGALAQALAVFQQVLALLDEANARAESVDILRTIGDLSVALGNTTGGLECYGQAEARCVAPEERREIWQHVTQIARQLEERDLGEAAAELYAETVRVGDLLDPIAAATSRFRLGRLLLDRLVRPQDAWPLLKAAAPILDRSGHDDATRARECLARCGAQLGLQGS